MKYTVQVSPEAQRELEQAFQWLNEQTPMHAPRWHDQLIDALISLETNPARCPVILRDELNGEEYRQLLFGDKRHAYRIVFLIRAEYVWVGHIRHAARK